MNVAAFLNTVTTRTYSLPIVILYVTAGCNLRCMMCSYRDPLPDELTLEEIEKLADDLSRLGLRHIVYSGGEPLTRRDFPSILRVFQGRNVKQSLLTNGLLLFKRYEEIRSFLSEIIVSVDGPAAEIHDSIRGLESFAQIVRGIREVVLHRPRPQISIRTVLHKKNFRELGRMVEFAKDLGVDSISFLPADVLSNAFHRDRSGVVAERSEIVLTEADVGEFRGLMNNILTRYSKEIHAGFVAEHPQKLLHIVQYFEAMAGKAELPRNTCNAPMISTVITSRGEVLPCFFLPPFGNIRQNALKDLLNKSEIRKTRRDVRHYTLQRCHECVCTLNVRPLSALVDKF